MLPMSSRFVFSAKIRIFYETMWHTMRFVGRYESCNVRFLHYSGHENTKQTVEKHILRKNLQENTTNMQ